MRRMPLAIAMAAILLTMAGSVSAVSQTVTPSTQTHGHGVSSNWTQSWGGSSPFDVAFCPQNTPAPTYCFTSLTNTTLTSKSRSYTFYPCVSTLFQQYAWVHDNVGASSTVYTTSREAGGNPCP